MIEQTTALPSGDELEERERRFGKYLPVEPLRRTRVPTALQGLLPEFERIAAEREGFAESSRRVGSQYDEWRKRVAKAEYDHQLAVRAAMLAGAPMPEPFEPEEWVGPERTLDLYLWVDRILEAEELCLMTENADLLRERLAEQLRPQQSRLDKANEALRKAQEAAAKVEAVVTPIHAAVAVLDEIAPRPAHEAGEEPVGEPQRRRNPYDDRALRALKAQERLLEDFNASKVLGKDGGRLGGRR